MTKRQKHYWDLQSYCGNTIARIRDMIKTEQERQETIDDDVLSLLNTSIENLEKAGKTCMERYKQL